MPINQTPSFQRYGQMAVAMRDCKIRASHGSLVFKPPAHGALLRQPVFDFEAGFLELELVGGARRWFSRRPWRPQGTGNRLSVFLVRR
jgi:hypothetical protein